MERGINETRKKCDKEGLQKVGKSPSDCLFGSIEATTKGRVVVSMVTKGSLCRVPGNSPISHLRLVTYHQGMCRDVSF